MADRRIAVLAALLSLVLLPAGCTRGTPTTRQPDEGPASVSTPPVRTDREPIAKRFPHLGDFAEVHWQGGSLVTDTGGVPGLTDVYIHALVVLRPETQASITSRYQWKSAPSDWDAEMSPELRSFLPANGTWVSDEKFTESVTTDKYYGAVYFDTATGTVYLDVINT